MSDINDKPICLNCIYKGESVASKPKSFEHTHYPLHEFESENYICKNLNNGVFDFISGATHLKDCQSCNGFGECIYYEAIPEEDEPIIDEPIVDDPDEPIDPPETNDETESTDTN